MSGKIFINYRRGDDPGNTGRLFDQLQDVFPRDRLFMDVDSIPPGRDFVRVLDEQVEIAIADTGKGIPVDVRSRIFDPFFTTKEVGKGTGQGLAIARTVVVEKHGGTLHFETELGKGTTFYIRLPINGPGNASAAA